MKNSLLLLAGLTLLSVGQAAQAETTKTTRMLITRDARKSRTLTFAITKDSYGH